MPGITARAALILMLAAAVQAPLPARAEPGHGLPYAVPSFIQGVQPEQTEWISAERATTDDDHVDWQLLGEDVRRGYEAIRTTPYETIMIRMPGQQERELDPYASGPRPDGVYYGQSHHCSFNGPPDETLEDQIENAEAALLGDVIAVTPGFYQGIPYTLLSIRLDRYGGKSHKEPGSPVAHIAYPVAEFTIGDITFYKGDPSFPATPEVGDRLLFFSYRWTALSAETVLRAEHDKMAIERADGSVSAPEKWELSGFDQAVAALIPAVELLVERYRELPRIDD